VTPKPEITVAVPSHGRPLRLRWLLHALADQTLERDRFEVLIGHDADDPVNTAIVANHPLAAAGVLRGIPTESTVHGAKRNELWRAARAPLVAGTDDDCRPPVDWLENALAAARAHPDAIVQGATWPDPDEEPLQHAAVLRTTQWIDPPTASGQTCNIVYPREWLERMDGFDETFAWVGEDTDLLQRAIEAGAQYVGAPEVVSYHAVDVWSLAQFARRQQRWQHLPRLFAAHPVLRRHATLRIFWKPTHPGAVLALTATPAALAARKPLLAAALTIPWAIASYRTRPVPGWRGKLRATADLPIRFGADASEVVALVRGSIRHRTLLL
jgi:hypothetical protein